MKQLDDVSFEDLYQRMCGRAQEREPSESWKRCCWCGEQKPRTADYFYRQTQASANGDGLSQPCKPCTRRRINAAKAKRREEAKRK